MEQKKRNLQFESGYSEGYNWVINGGGVLGRINTELKNRSSTFNPKKYTSWDHGFKKGVEDAIMGLSQKYQA